MAEARLSLDLLAPGLLGPFPAGRPVWGPPALPALETLLARARCQALSPPSPERLLLTLAGVEPTADIPVGALCRLADGAQPDSHYWLRADPVSLVAEQSALYLMASDELSIDAAEAESLAAAFNRHFAEDALVLETPCPGRWYLRTENLEVVHTTPLAEALGCDVHPLLPQGAGAVRWHALINEVQMLLHAHPVNQLRMEQGRPVINSLWFWGGGTLPEAGELGWQRIFSADCLGQGVAKLHGCPVMPAAGAGEVLAAGEGRVLAVLPDLRLAINRGEAGCWQQQLLELEQAWFAPLLAALKAGRLGRLRLLPAAGHQYTLDRSRARRWWRRRRTLTAWLGEGY